jgi:hypothetical protein
MYSVSLAVDDPESDALAQTGDRLWIIPAGTRWLQVIGIHRDDGENSTWVIHKYAVGQ